MPISATPSAEHTCYDLNSKFKRWTHLHANMRQLFLFRKLYFDGVAWSSRYRGLTGFFSAVQAIARQYYGACDMYISYCPRASLYSFDDPL